MISSAIWKEHGRDRGRSLIEGAHILIFGFTNRENNQFQKKLRGRIRIYEYGPPQLPIFRGPCMDELSMMQKLHESAERVQFGVIEKFTS